MHNMPRSVSIALLFLLLHALIWFGFAILAAAGLLVVVPQNALIRWGLAFLAALAAGALVGLTLLLRRRYRPAYSLTLAALGLLAVLTFTDQVGPADWVYFVLTLAPLALLIKERSWYLQRGTDSAKRTGTA
ncbi:MAG: hypothetical protein ACYC4R_16310 [Anaerolineae bacterium]